MQKILNKSVVMYKIIFVMYVHVNYTLIILIINNYIYYLITIIYIIFVELN